MIRLLTPFLLFSCLCVTCLLAGEPANDPNSLQLELQLLNTRENRSRRQSRRLCGRYSAARGRCPGIGKGSSCAVATSNSNSVYHTSARERPYRPAP